MAKRDPKKETASKGKKQKSLRWSAQTIANKLRRAETRANHLRRAAERRASSDWTNPLTGKKARAGVLKGKINARLIQAERISKKRGG